MPFTFAHPAAVLWCARWRGAGVPFSAFVIGAMSPDFEYFLRLNIRSVYGHTPAGVVTFCVPVGFAVYLVFHRVVAAPLRAHLPGYFRRRLAPNDVGFSLARARTVILICLAIAFGAMTHAIWDGFTHYHGVFVTWLPWLRHEVFGLGIYRYLQHGSTLLGLFAMTWWFHRQPSPPSEEDPARFRGFWPVAALTFCASMIVLIRIAPFPGLATWVICAVDALFLSILMASLMARWREPGTVEPGNLAV